MASPKDILTMLDEGGYEFVDLRFCDLPGQVQHFTIPATQLGEDGFSDGFGFDGSSIRGFQEIQESDMILVPDPDTAVEDTFRAHKTLILYCFVKDPITGQSYDKDPRYVAQKAEAYLKSSGVADISSKGPGTPGARRRAATRPTSPGTRRGTSRCRPPTTSRTCGLR